jgi:hypothetical protein
MPTKPKISARDAVRDIRSGMTDSQMMDKYGLSAKGLQSLVLKLLEAKAITPAEIDRRKDAYHDTTVIQQIDGSDMVNDILSGMSDSDLMEKYGLSSEGLGLVFQTLTDTQVITLEEMYGTSSLAHDTVFVEDSRELLRHYLAIGVEIYESELSDIRGMLSNITEKGIAITGISAGVGDTKTFVIPTKDFIKSDPILFEARCLWTEKERDTGQWLAGFEITRISKECRHDLRSLIEVLPFLD